MYKVSNNNNRVKRKKAKKDKSKANDENSFWTPSPKIAYSWSAIENMSCEELDIYLTTTFKINH